MAGKTTAKPKVTNGINKTEPEISMTYIDDILLKISKTEEDVEEILVLIDGLCLDGIKEAHKELTVRVGKVEARLGIG